jgi:hypothetical protein
MSKIEAINICPRFSLDITDEYFFPHGGEVFLFNAFNFLFLPGRVVHVCNHSYSGGRDQKDNGSRPTWEKSWQDPISACGWMWWQVPVI